MARGVPGHGPAGGYPVSGSVRRWRAYAVAAGAGWLLLTMATRSPIAGTLLLVPVSVLVAVGVIAMRSLGITKEHPLLRAAATRPWRDGPRVFRLATSRLSQVFIITPKGSLIAPGAVDVRMNPDDIESLEDMVEPDLAHEFAVEAYEAAIARKSARVLGGRRVDVRVVADPAMPAGRYVLRQRREPGAVVPAGAGAAGSVPRGGRMVTRTKTVDQVTRTEYGDNPCLQLVTGGSVTQTRTSGARAGRGQAAELTLPDKPTVSRVHAKFTCAGGQWQITGLGRNGVLVNGAPLTGTRPVYDGDLLRWGARSDAPTSKVVIG